MEEQINSSWDNMLDRLAEWMDTAIMNLPNLIMAILVFALTYWIARYLGSWLNRPLRKFIKQPSIRNLVTSIFTIIIVALGLFLSLGIMNLDTVLKSLLAGAGVAGLAVGLALQGTLSNTFSGIFLAVRDVLNVGDWVETNGYAGVVEEIDLRNTKIRGADNNMIVLPNRMVLENPFKNYGLTSRIRCTIECGVTYDANLEQVRSVGIQSVEEVFPTKGSENTEFHYLEFGGSSINFQIRFWIDARASITILEARSKAIMALKAGFDKNDISIPFPIRTLVFDEKKELADAFGERLRSEESSSGD